MNRYHRLLLLAVSGTLFTSCGSPNYFIEEASKRSPHAVLSIRNGATQVLKIDGKYPPEGGAPTVRLTPGRHQIEVASSGQRVSVLGGIFGAPSQEVSAQGLMNVDLAPGRYYRPEASMQSAGTYFYLRDDNGVRTGATRSYSSAY